MKNEKSLFEPPFRNLRGNVCTPSIAHWKARGRLPILIYKLFRYNLRLRCYKQKSVEVGVFQRGWVTLSANFRQKGALPTNHCWPQNSRVIALLCSIKISAVHYLVLAQSTDEQNYNSQDRTSIDMLTWEKLVSLMNPRMFRLLTVSKISFKESDAVRC